MARDFSSLQSASILEKSAVFSSTPPVRLHADALTRGAAALFGALCAVERQLAVSALVAASAASDSTVARLLDAIAFHAELTAMELLGLAAEASGGDERRTLGEQIVFGMSLVGRLADLARSDGRVDIVELCEQWLDQRGRLVAAWSAALSASRT